MFRSRSFLFITTFVFFVVTDEHDTGGDRLTVFARHVDGVAAVPVPCPRDRPEPVDDTAEHSLLVLVSGEIADVAVEAALHTVLAAPGSLFAPALEVVEAELAGVDATLELALLECGRVGVIDVVDDEFCDAVSPVALVADDGDSLPLPVESVKESGTPSVVAVAGIGRL